MRAPIPALLLLSLGVSCATDDGARAPGPPLKPATGGLGTVAGEPLRIEVLRTVEAALADLDEHGRRSDEGQVLTPDWRRARALGAWVSATLLARAVADEGVVVDAADLERVALPFVLSAERHLSPSDSAERARIDRVARRLALRLTAGPALLKATGGAPAPTEAALHFLHATPDDDDGPLVEVLIATLSHPEERLLRKAAPGLGRRAREPKRLWKAGEALVPGAVLERAWLSPGRTPPGLREPLFAAASGTIVGPVRVPEGLAVAKVLRRHATGNGVATAPRARQALERQALRALDASLWADAEVKLDDVGLQRWLSAADLGPAGNATWVSPCEIDGDSARQRCEALNRFLEGQGDPSRFVAAPRDALLNACDAGGEDACVALGDDRGLKGPRLSSLWRDRQGCSDATWPCERVSLLKPLASTPLASAPRTLSRLARRCAVWDPRTCPRFAALLDELRTPVAKAAPRPRQPPGPLAWALARGCARSADVVTCHVARSLRPSLETRVLTCFEGGSSSSGRSLRAAACKQLAERATDLEGQRLALTQACELGETAACHRAAQTALAAGDLDVALTRARRALDAPGDDVGPEAATSLRLIAADTGCNAGDASACSELAEHLLAASGDEGQGAERAKALLSDACRTSGAACASVMRLALRPEAPDLPLALTMATAACRGGVEHACQTAGELREMLAACPLDDDEPAGCRPLAALFLDEDADEETRDQGLALLGRACRAGDSQACDTAVRMTLVGGVGLRAAVALCQQPSALRVSSCRRVRELPAKEQACRGGDANACLELGGPMLRMKGPEADVARGRAILDEACRRDVEAACAALLSGDGRAKEAALRAVCDRPTPDTRGRACAELVQHVRTDTGDKPRGAEAMTLAEQACSSGDAIACRLLGEIWMSGEGGEWSIPGARSAWDEGCRRGDRLSCDRARAWSGVE